jgi:LuxR family maltose regulon positive regulatory protein
MDHEPAWVEHLLVLAEQARSAAPADDEAVVDTTATPHPALSGPRSPNPPEPSWLLTTKLFIPRPPAGLVARPRLSERLTDALSVPLTLIAAPAGSGKSTLLAAWLAEAQHAARRTQNGPSTSRSNALSFGWLTLDTGDNDLGTFLHYLVAALQRAAPNVGAATLAQLHQPLPSLRALLTPLINDLAERVEPCLLILDDYHVITEPAIHDAVMLLVEQLAGILHVVLSSRDDPPLPLARLRARRQLFELRVGDLRFTSEEVAAFLGETMALPVSAAEAAALTARTEGWAVGLQFAALALQGRTDRSDFLEALSGTNRYLMDYLASEVLDRLPAHLRSFLLQTAVLERMCGPLCDATLGLSSAEVSTNAESYSQLVLEELERRHLFMVPLDDQRQWYRYHHLFAGVLRQQLLAGAGTRKVADLHRRAGAWYVAEGLGVEAIPHALAAEDWQLAADWIERFALDLTLQGRLRSTLAWVRRLPPEVVLARPFLCIIDSGMLIFTGQTAAAAARIIDAEAALRPETPPELTRFIQAWVLVNRAHLARDRGDLAQCVALGRQAVPLFGNQEQIGSRSALFYACHAFLVDGDVQLERATRISADLNAIRRRTQSLAAIGSPFLLSRLFELQGRLGAALAVLKEDDAPDELARLRALSRGPKEQISLGAICYERNALSEAERYLTEGIELTRGELVIEAEYVLRGQLTLARLVRALGDMGRARAVLDAAEAFAHERSVAPHLHERVAAAWAEQWLAEGALEAAAGWATPYARDVDEALEYRREDVYLALARIGIALNEPVQRRDAMLLLDRLLNDAEAKGRHDSVIRAAPLRALARAASGDQLGALADLRRALGLAAPESYVRVFLDAGDGLYDLLNMLLTSADGALSAEERVHAERLRSVFAPSATAIDPLSPREREILHLVVAGASNSEIAAQLRITTGAVKKHLNRLFGKLGVQSREELAAHAREFGAG